MSRTVRQVPLRVVPLDILNVERIEIFFPLPEAIQDLAADHIAAQTGLSTRRVRK